MTAGFGSVLVLIIDRDLGFLMWLGEMFSQLGCQAIPALSCRKAQALARELSHPIAILLVNPDLPGAARTVKTLAAANPGLRVIAIGNPSTAFQAESTLERPSTSRPVSRPEWVAKIRKILLQGYTPLGPISG